MKNKIYHAIGKFFQKVSRWFFHRTLMACWHCGALVGMNSTYARGHMWCEPCLQRYVMPELWAAQQSVQRTVDQPCEKHNMEFCSECFPVVVVDFNRR